MAFSQNWSGLQTMYPVMTSCYIPGFCLEFARFYGEINRFKHNFSIENSSFRQFSYHAVIFSKISFKFTLSVRAVETHKEQMNLTNIPINYPFVTIRPPAL